MDAVVKEFNIKSPVTGNSLTDAVKFNLMFPLFVGATGKNIAM